MHPAILLPSLLQAAEQAGEGTSEPSTGLFGGSWIPLILIGLVFWFVLIGPERKNRKRREAMLAALQKGDEVMTNGGLFGRIAMVQDDRVTLQVDEGVRLRFSRSAIQTVVERSEAGGEGDVPAEGERGEAKKKG